MDSREFKGVSPSMAGNGPRLIYLTAISDIAVDPQQQTWAMMGLYVHNKLSYHKYTQDVMSEVKLRDDEASGIADVLEKDENREGYYILSDYKTYASYKAAKVMGLVKHGKQVVLDNNGMPVVYLRNIPKYGIKAGEPKLEDHFIIDEKKAQNHDVTLQLNRYRIFFNQHGYKISKLQIMITPRDANTINAKKRGITKNLYIVQIPIIEDRVVLGYYRKLSEEVTHAFLHGTIRRCNKWESWDGVRCQSYCNVAAECKMMDDGKLFHLP